MYNCFTFPDIPSNLSDQIFRDDKKMVVVGVIGKSCFPDCNKMAGLNVLNLHPSLIDDDCYEGKMQFYYKSSEQMIFIHFQTTYDNYCMYKMFETCLADGGDKSDFMSFQSYTRTRFAKILLFAIEICHIVVFVEIGEAFDSSYISLFKSLKLIREKHVIKFLPKLVKNSNTGSFLGKDGRLCSPRFLFFFENPTCIKDLDEESIHKLEFDMEDNIYKVLRNEFIITNNSSASLFSIPGNKRFVYFNKDESLRKDPLMLSVGVLSDILEKSMQKDEILENSDDLRPFPGFAKPIKHYKSSKEENKNDKVCQSFNELLKEHVQEALQVGFDDSMSKYKGKSHFVIPNMKAWLETFKLLHKIFIENPDNPNFEANDPDYKAYLENFHRIMDIDDEFFSKCCDTGLNKAITLYNNPMMTHYGSEIHRGLTDEAIKLYMKYARGPNTKINEKKLIETCEEIWKNGKQQCEIPSLRGNPCVMPKHNVKDATEHSSGVVFVSTCNCGRIQGRREDPYTIRQANFEFYQILANSCASCNKLEHITFPIFQPSINDYKPAEVDTSFSKMSVNENKSVLDQYSDNSEPLTASQRSHTNLSLESINDISKINCDSSDESVNELVIKVGNNSLEKDKSALSQPSTTEYLPGMVHEDSPLGLLPQFPSFSLTCIGPSSVYSHSTGLLELFQSGFLSGANFLLPWDVHVRLEHSASWVAAYEKTRYCKKGQVFILKIFVGCEYECPRGHRFIMSSPDKVLRGGSEIARNSGSKVVFNDMPLYFPCPCRNTKMMVAQLMRIHVVTPKAPVNVILNPKIRTGERNYIFTMGLPDPPKLSQSAYWILRLPYIYQGDDGPIIPPAEVTSSSSMIYGSLLAEMYGVSETESET